MAHTVGGKKSTMAPTWLAGTLPSAPVLLVLALLVGIARRRWWPMAVAVALVGHRVEPSLATALMARPLDTPAVTPNVSVVICAYTEQRWDDLVQAVASVRHQSTPPGEIVLVIDHCPALQQRATLELEGIVVVPNRHQNGLSGARNTGIGIATYDIVAFLDDDAVAAPDWISQLTTAYADPRVLGVGGRVHPRWREERPAWFPTEFDWVVGCSHRGMPTTLGPVRNFIGANMSFRREVLRETSGFRAELGRIGAQPLGCEETELCIRVQRQFTDSVLLYQPAAEVWHSVPAHRGTWSYFRSRCYSEGLSKAAVSRLVGANQALRSERSYLASTITRGIARSLGQVFRGRLAGIAIALAMVAGVATTVRGYTVGQVRTRRFSGGETKRAVGPKSLAAAAHLLALPAALALWLAALPRIHLDRMGDLGLVPLLPPIFWLALALLLVGYCANLVRSNTPTPVLVGHLLALIAILHATPSLLYGTLRYSWAWKHVGVVDFFMRHAGVDHSISELSAYQYWPGFFTLNAMLTKASGLATPLGYAVWGPPFFNALTIGPLFLIFRTFTADRRLIWSATGIYFLGSWVGQDYFSPQACAYFLYLSIIALCLRYLKAKRRPAACAAAPSRTDAATQLSAVTSGQLDGPELSARDRRLLIGVAVVPMMAAIVPTHQLTPLMLVSALVVLTVFCRQRVATLAMLMIGFTLGWDLLLAGPWIAQNLSGIGASLGTLGANANSGFINLAGASKGQVVVAQVDRMHSAAIWTLAILGFARRFRRRRELALPLLAVAPMPMILANDYGGEMIFRLYLFGLPFAAFYAAACFFPRETAGRSWWARLALPAVVLLLVPGFIFSYYGKEEDNHFSPAEVQAARFVYGVAPRGSLIVGATSDFPWGFTNYEFYDYERFALEDPHYRRAVLANPIGTFTDMMALQQHHHAYLLLTRSQSFDVEMTGIMPPGSLTRIEQTLTHSPGFTVIYRNADAVVITLVAPARDGAS
jgi:glycosyltransferase involved in cell wall biosynthesis